MLKVRLPRNNTFKRFDPAPIRRPYINNPAPRRPPPCPWPSPRPSRARSPPARVWLFVSFFASKVYSFHTLLYFNKTNPAPRAQRRVSRLPRRTDTRGRVAPPHPRCRSLWLHAFARDRLPYVKVVPIPVYWFKNGCSHHRKGALGGLGALHGCPGQFRLRSKGVESRPKPEEEQSRLRGPVTGPRRAPI